MIILDTNVISEIIKGNPDERVFQWFDSLNEPTFITSITIGEMQRGIMNLPDGKRKQGHITSLETVLKEFKEHFFMYDTKAALAYGSLCSTLKSKGIGVGQADAMIAAITLVHGATFATRNVKDFVHSGIPIVNPFDFQEPE